MRIAMTLIACVALFCRVSHGQGEPAQSKPAPVSSTRLGAGLEDWRELLQKYGAFYSLYFTIESDQFDVVPGDTRMPPMEAKRFQ